jgi:hypothetical protein
MNLLFLVPKHEYDTKMSRVRFEEVEALKVASPQVNVHMSGPGWPDWPEGLLARDYVLQRCIALRDNLSEKPHVVYSYGVTGLAGSPIPVALKFHETYNWRKTLGLIQDTGATLVFFTYANDIETYREALKDYRVLNGHPAKARALEIEHLPHGADAGIYHPYQGAPEKPIDVLVVGNLAQDFYPFRARLARLAQRELKKRGYAVVTLPHPGFRAHRDADGTMRSDRPAAVIGEPYARMLSRAKLVISCTSRQKYAFCKLVEIPLCGALPISDLPWERKGFFAQTTLNVEMWHTDREILGRIEDLLDDEGELTRRTTIAHDKVAQRLTLAHWAERFIYHARRHVWGESPAPPTPLVEEGEA